MPHNSIPVNLMFQPVQIAPYYEIPRADVSALQSREKYETITNVKFAVEFISPLSEKVSTLDSPAYIAEQNRSRSAIDESASNWLRYTLDVSASTDVDTLSETVDAIYDAIDRFGPGAVNFTNLPTAGINGVHLAAILRSTYAFKNQVIGWVHGRDVAIKALRTANIEIDDALAGLL